MENNIVWIITGTSSGIGLSIVKKLLSSGFKVSALTRKPEKLENELKSLLNLYDSNNLIIIKTDITNDESVKDSVRKTIDKFDRIDVVVNNAGYGLVGSIEELTDIEYRKIYDVNVFGVLNLLRHTTPYLRKQRSGTIINVSSTLGWGTMKCYSAYSSTKHAVNSITFSAQKELKQFNINVILICPGGFRTGFVIGYKNNKEIENENENEKNDIDCNFQIPNNMIDEYKTNELIERFYKYSPIAIGDPEKAADVLIQLTKMKEEIPSHLFLGSDSLNQSNNLLKSHLNENEKWSNLSISTDLDKDKQSNMEIPKLY
ncbi:hypothetical protein RB653_008658 [Dictyostelium firmibasis]|uniref:Uncharacterized protein n=1 Tax=Dictyostelium firmibasis TaxID=79012 RepID=A0AAN7TZG3_9MYCE